MAHGSNTAARIAELRRDIAALKGKASRAEATALDLRSKALQCREDIRRAQNEIEAMGGKVRR